MEAVEPIHEDVREQKERARERRRDMQTNKRVVLGLALIGIGGLAVTIWWGPTDELLRTPRVDTRMHGREAGLRAKPPEEVVVPALSQRAERGKAAFEQFCSTCHGAKAAGSRKGPSLVHKIYEPAHHPDQTFLLAARNGVRAHHWQFGEMPPVPDVPDRQIDEIVSYVREIQRANGIE